MLLERMQKWCRCEKPTIPIAIERCGPEPLPATEITLQTGEILLSRSSIQKSGRDTNQEERRAGTVDSTASGLCILGAGP